MRVGAFESKLSSSNTNVRELKSQLALKNSEVDVPATEFGPTDHRCRFAENATSLMPEDMQIKGTQLCEVEVAHLAAEVARMAGNLVLSHLLC